MTTRLVRALLFTAAAVLFAAAAAAQDPRAIEAQNAAREWLALVDRGDTGASWNRAGALFQKALSEEQWTKNYQRARAPLGAPVTRGVLSTRFSKTAAGVPDGDYATVIFRSSFAANPSGRETVTLSHETAGGWRVIGYLIR